MSATREYTNVYGRRGGRGWRPWLLVPKVVFAATFLGGLISLLVLVFLQPRPDSPADWLREANLVRRAYMYVVVPGLLGAMLTGVLLALAHPLVFLRMRWLQVKLALMAVFVPVFHFSMSSRSVALREAVARQDSESAGSLRGQLLFGTIGALVLALSLIVLGRLKPRLGQNYARLASASESATRDAS